MLVCVLLLFYLSGGFTAGIYKHKDDRHQHPRLSTPVLLQSKTPEIDANYWNSIGQETVRKHFHQRKIEGRAKNVIFFLGDGMSIPTVTATRVLTAGESGSLSFDNFPYTGFSKTYCVDRQVPDSACTSTAYLTGVKANYQTIGVTANVILNDCNGQANSDHHTHSIATWFQAQGKRTGFVTTTRVTHASPAGIYAHVADRNWESDKDVVESGKDPRICRDIGYQLMHNEAGKKLNVIMGGGRGALRPANNADEEDELGWRLDGKNLINKWQKDKERHNARYVWNREQLQQVNGSVDYLLGLFDSSHLAYNLDRNKSTEPSLEDMVSQAIRVLRRGDEGYFLFVEGGRIDTAHHDATAHKSLDECKEFHKAIQRAVDMTNLEETLIVVTADHAHAMSLSGYPLRGSNVLGLSGGQDQDGLDYFIINYSNGPGYRRPNLNGTRPDTSQENYHDKNFKYAGMFPLEAETHGGDDVGIYARGPWAHLFTGVIEQNAIPHIMAFAACVGNGLKACDVSYSGEANRIMKMSE